AMGVGQALAVIYADVYRGASMMAVLTQAFPVEAQHLQPPSLVPAPAWPIVPSRSYLNRSHDRHMSGPAQVPPWLLRTKLIVQPPKPPPIMRAPTTSSKVLTSSTKKSNSGQLTS